MDIKSILKKYKNKIIIYRGNEYKVKDVRIDLYGQQEVIMLQLLHKQYNMWVNEKYIQKTN